MLFCTPTVFIFSELAHKKITCSCLPYSQLGWLKHDNIFLLLFSKFHCLFISSNHISLTELFSLAIFNQASKNKYIYLYRYSTRNRSGQGYSGDILISAKAKLKTSTHIFWPTIVNANIIPSRCFSASPPRGKEDAALQSTD